jgi:hypothetical protein
MVGQSIVAHTSNLGTLESETRGSQFKDAPDKTDHEPVSENRKKSRKK